MSQPIRGQVGHLVFPIGSKNTNLVEGVEILLSVKFRWIPFSDFRGEVENVKVYAGRTDDDGRTDDGRCAMTIAHLSLRLRWAKKKDVENLITYMCYYGWDKKSESYKMYSLITYTSYISEITCISNTPDCILCIFSISICSGNQCTHHLTICNKWPSRLSHLLRCSF